MTEKWLKNGSNHQHYFIAWWMPYQPPCPLRSKSWHQEVTRCQGSGQPGREWKMAIQNCSVKQMAVTFIPHTIHVWYIYLHLVDLYGRSMDAMGTVLPKQTIIYEKKNKTNKTSLRTFLFSLLNQCPERPAVRVVQKQNSWSRSTGHCDGSAIQPCAWWLCGIFDIYKLYACNRHV